MKQRNDSVADRNREAAQQACILREERYKNMTRLVRENDHPDPGWLWRRCEVEWINDAIARAAQVLGAEIRELREKLDQQTQIAREQIAYAIALQQAIETHCRGESAFTGDCPHHAEKLNDCLERHSG